MQHPKYEWKPAVQISQYLDQLKEVLEENDCPGKLYNVDETGIPFDHHAPNVVAKNEHNKSMIPDMR